MPKPPGPPVSEMSISLRILKALSDASAPSSSRDLDLLGQLDEAKKKVNETWPDAKPSGDGVDYLDKIMRIFEKRLRWREKIATGEEVVRLLGKLSAVLAVFAFSWSQWLA